MLYIDDKLIRFLIAGVINTLVGTGLMFILYNLAHCSYWVSSAANYIVGGIVSFFLNKYFTFRNNEKSVKQVIKFIIIILFSYLLAYGIAKPIAIHVLQSQPVEIQENVALCIGMVFYVVLNYLGQRIFVFNSK